MTKLSSQFVQENGASYWLYRANAKGRPLLVVNGGPGLSHDYLKSLVELCPRRPVIFYDQLGCGVSQEEGVAREYALGDFVSELASLIESLPFSELDLLAHSFGSMIAVDYLLADQAKIRHLTLVSPVLSISAYQDSLGRVLQKMPATYQKIIKDSVLSQSYESLEFKEAMAAFTETNLCRLKLWPDELFESSMGVNTFLRDSLWGVNDFSVTGSLKNYERIVELTNIFTPTTIMCGEFDYVDEISCQLYLANFPNATLSMIPNSSHMCFLENPNYFSSFFN